MSDPKDNKVVITVTAELVEGEEKITVTDDLGNERELKGVVVCGGDFETGAFYAFSWGASADAGWSLANFYRFCALSKRAVDRVARKIFAVQAHWMATFHGMREAQEISAEELLSRWEEEDQEKTMHDHACELFAKKGVIH